MTTPVIIDLTVAGVLLAAALWGAHRGLFRALAGLAAVAAALVGAALIAGTLAAPAARAAAPLIQAGIESRVEEALALYGPETPDGADDPELEELLALMGLDGDVRRELADGALARMQDAGETLSAAVVQSVAESLLHAALFLLSFLALLVLLKLAAGALDLVTRLPGVHALNALGGAVIGLVEGALAVFVAVWLLRRFGVSFETPDVSATHLLRFFTTHTPVSALASLLR